MLSKSPVLSLNHDLIFIILLFLITPSYFTSCVLYIFREFAPVALLGVNKRSSLYRLNFKIRPHWWRLFPLFSQKTSSLYSIELRGDSLSLPEIQLDLIHNRMV